MAVSGVHLSTQYESFDFTQTMSPSSRNKEIAEFEEISEKGKFKVTLCWSSATVLDPITLTMIHTYICKEIFGVG